MNRRLGDIFEKKITTYIFDKSKKYKNKKTRFAAKAKRQDIIL